MFHTITVTKRGEAIRHDWREHTEALAWITKLHMAPDNTERWTSAEALCDGIRMASWGCQEPESITIHTDYAYGPWLDQARELAAVIGDSDALRTYTLAKGRE